MWKLCHILASLQHLYLPMTLLVMKSCRSSPKDVNAAATPSRGGPASVTGRSWCWGRGAAAGLQLRLRQTAQKTWPREHRSLRRIMGIGNPGMTTIPCLAGLASYSGQSMPGSPRDVGQARINEAGGTGGHRLEADRRRRKCVAIRVCGEDQHHTIPTDANLLADGLQENSAPGARSWRRLLESRSVGDQEAASRANVSRSAGLGHQQGLPRSSRRRAIWQGGGGVPIGRC